MKRVAFLYNHDAAHQVAHLAGIMRHLALDHPVAVAALVAKPTGEGVARRLVGARAEAAIEWLRLGLSPTVKRIARGLDRLWPYSRLMTLRENADAFRLFDAVVSSERTCLRIRRHLGDAAPRIIHVPHGSGDRNVAHHPQIAEFDLSLVSGRKLVEVGQSFGILGEDDWRIIGYPKFDAIDLQARPRLFDNDNPVFLYNPHFDPYLSSVYRFGEAVLALFERHPEWNLIFAPHVMYGRKRLHYSLEHRTFGWRRDVIRTDWTAPNILIDWGSQRSIDMTYTRAADVYIGDVSSQIYEYLARPRAAFFLDARGVDGWRDDPEYQFWRNGPVLRSVEALEAMLPTYEQVAREYRAEQERLFAYTIDMTDEPAGVRGARAVADYVAQL